MSLALSIVVMGPMGAGKSTLARALAQAMAAPFIEGDDLHAPESIAKLRAGVVLTDADRWSWLARVGEALRSGGVAACSALTQRYRDALRNACGREVLFVSLDVPRAELEQRLAKRTGHFASPALLESQLAALERPAEDELSICVQPSETLESIVARCLLAYSSAERMKRV